MERKRIEQPGLINSSRSCAIGDTRDTKIKMTRQRRLHCRAVFTSQRLSEEFLRLPVAWIQCRDTSRYGRLSALPREGEQNISTPAAELQDGSAPLC